MTEPSGPALSRPQCEMLAHVEAVLTRHPRLQPFLEHGWSIEPACDDDAIWVDATAVGRNVSTRLETPRWWLPGRSGRALAIAEELAVSLEAALLANRKG